MLKDKATMPPQVTDFSISSLHAVLFVQGSELSTMGILLAIGTVWEQPFDGEPTVLPHGVPAEMPRILLGSSDGQWRAQIGAQRVDIFWRAQAMHEDGATAYDRLIELVRSYAEATSVVVQRMALVTHWFVECESPAEFLVEHFAQDRWRSAPFDRPGNFELHAHKVHTFAGFEVNSWVRNRSGLLNTGSGSTAAITVEMDLNTVVGASPVELEDLARFFAGALQEQRGTLGLYYTNTGA